MVACCLVVLSSAYATSSIPFSAVDHLQLINSETSFSSESQNNFELGVISPCPEGLSAMGWLDGLVICSSAVGFVDQSFVDDLVHEVESIQRSHDLSYGEKIVYLSDLMTQHSLLSQEVSDCSESQHPVAH